jgi:hypothetical protein
MGSKDNTKILVNGSAPAIFDPLLNIIDGLERIYISPDGEITKIPFEILPINNSTYVIDRFCITYLSSCKDILRFNLPINDPLYESAVLAK